jgi:hypothetical protein
MDLAGERVALLIIRVWIENDANAPALHARLTATHALADREVMPRITLSANVDEVCDHVRRWLVEFLEGEAPAAELPDPER